VGRSQPSEQRDGVGGARDLLDVPRAGDDGVSTEVEGDLCGGDGAISDVVDGQGVLLVGDSVGEPAGSGGGDGCCDVADGACGEGEVTGPEEERRRREKGLYGEQVVILVGVVEALGGDVHGGVPIDRVVGDNGVVDNVGGDLIGVYIISSSVRRNVSKSLVLGSSAIKYITKANAHVSKEGARVCGSIHNVTETEARRPRANEDAILHDTSIDKREGTVEDLSRGVTSC